MWSTDELVLLAFAGGTFLAIFNFVAMNFALMARHAALTTIFTLIAGFVAMLLFGAAAAVTDVSIREGGFLIAPRGFAWIYAIAVGVFSLHLLGFSASLAFVLGYESSRLQRAESAPR